MVLSVNHDRELTCLNQMQRNLLKPNAKVVLGAENVWVHGRMTRSQFLGSKCNKLKSCYFATELLR